MMITINTMKLLQLPLCPALSPLATTSHCHNQLRQLTNSYFSAQKSTFGTSIRPEQNTSCHININRYFSSSCFRLKTDSSKPVKKDSTSTPKPAKKIHQNHTKKNISTPPTRPSVHVEKTFSEKVADHILGDESDQRPLSQVSLQRKRHVVRIAMMRDHRFNLQREHGKEMGDKLYFASMWGAITFMLSVTTICVYLLESWLMVPLRSWLGII